MTPAARVDAAIACLDLVIAAARDAGPAADTVLQRYFATRRYAGSKDRRAVRDLVYDVMRGLGERPASGRAAMIAHARHQAPDLLALFGQGPHAPAALADGEAEATPGLAPDWLMGALAQRFGDATPAQVAALLGRAPLDVRANALKTNRDAVAALHPDWQPLPRTAHGLRLPAGLALDQVPAFRDGLIEVQDEGSQIAAATLAAQPGETIVDLCAGAGGKTLALAADMALSGRLLACDTDRGRLAQLRPRAVRAGADGIETRLLNPGHERAALADVMAACDGVIIDAPCSGSGTWRRNPEGRWRLTPARLERLAVTQAALIAIGAELLRPGGRLVYVVCSLLPAEGEGQLAQMTGLAPWQHRVLTPADDGCDGFFIAHTRRL
jgi:16S rRNA (cytosine967-C5)-methyltransferase